ncbi:MAG: hypothetical protein IJQ32_01070 [Paludibacteraceae bacterium]|nr:hypothetical protein [Paludibacteraceae bacterium]
MYKPVHGLAGIVADVTVVERGDECFARVKLIRADKATEITEVGFVDSKRYGAEMRSYAIGNAIDKAVKRYEQLFGRGPAATAEDMDQALKALKYALAQPKPHGLISSWSPQTTNVAIKYFERNVLPKIRAFADVTNHKFCMADRDDIESKLIEETMQRNGQDHDRAVESVSNHLRDADIIYAHMRDKNSNLPAIRLSRTLAPAAASRQEQVKHLPREVLSKLYESIAEMAAKDPKFALFAVLVVFGLRPAEAAAVKPHDISFYDAEEYCMVTVECQERAGKIDRRLKNKHSYRHVLCPKWGYTVLLECCNRIGEDYPHDDAVMNRAQDCAARVKNLLVQCGAGASDLDKLAESIEDDDLDLEDTRDKAKALRSDKVACYVLRRIFAGIMRHEMGLSLLETDRMLGHVPSDRGKMTKAHSIDMTNPDVQRDIVRRMERYIFLPHEQYSNNPAISAYQISEGDGMRDIIPYSEVRIANTTGADVTVEINISAAEAGELVEIILPSGAKQLTKLSALSTPKSWRGIDRMVIGDTTWRDAKNANN